MTVGGRLQILHMGNACGTTTTTAMKQQQQRVNSNPRHDSGGYNDDSRQAMQRSGRTHARTAEQRCHRRVPVPANTLHGNNSKKRPRQHWEGCISSTIRERLAPEQRHSQNILVRMYFT